MTSQIGQKLITKRVLPNISRYKGNQTMKFAHLREHNIRNVFFEKSNLVENVLPHTPIKNQS